VGGAGGGVGLGDARDLAGVSAGVWGLALPWDALEQ